MRKRLRWTLAFGAVFAVAVASVAIAKPIVIAAGNLIFTIDASISPKALPKNELTPVSFETSGNLKTKDGTHPPAANGFEGKVSKNGTVNAKGMAVCKQGQLEARTTKDAEKACKGSIIGKGFAEAEVEFAESLPFDARGPLIAFNGGTKGNKTLILLHVYANVPAPTAFITRVEVKKINQGRYGNEIDSKIPVVAGGAGSLKKFAISFGKTFTYKGKKQGYFLGSCPTGNFITEGAITFSDTTRLKGTIVVPCSAKG